MMLLAYTVGLYLAIGASFGVLLVLWCLVDGAAAYATAETMEEVLEQSLSEWAVLLFAFLLLTITWLPVLVDVVNDLENRKW